MWLILDCVINYKGEQPKPEAMRAFVLVSKVLQMLANGLSFSDKTSESYVRTPMPTSSSVSDRCGGRYMRDMNPLLEKHHDNVIAFFRAIAVRDFDIEAVYI